MVRFTSIMLNALMCSLAFSYISPAYANKTKHVNGTDIIPIYYNPHTNSTDMAPTYNSTTASSSTGPVYYTPNTSSTGMAPEHHPNSTDDGKHGSEHDEKGEHEYGNHDEHHEEKHDQVADEHHGNEHYGQDDHKSAHESSPVVWDEDDCEDEADDEDCDEDQVVAADCDDEADRSDHSHAKAVLRHWGLKSAGSKGRDRSYDSSSKDDKSASSKWSDSSSSSQWYDSSNGDRYDSSWKDESSNTYDECTMNEFDYNSRSCRAYGMFDDAKYNETTTAYTRSKGLMAFSDPLYMSKSELSGRTLSQLGVHFAICEDYNKKSGAQFRMGLYEKQRTSSKDRWSSWGGKSENWTMVAKTDLQKFNRRSDEYAMFSVDANSTIALKPNTYYTIITTIAPGSSMTMYTDDADSRPFSSFDFSGSDNNLPKSWDGKKSRSWSAVSMEMAMCRNKSNK